MFDFVRKHTKIMMFVMFLLIIPSFLLIGMDGYSRSQEKTKTVARVGGYEISQGEWDAAHKIESDRLRVSMPNLDAKLLDSPEARYATLERLVRDQVLISAANKLKLSTSDSRLARDLQENPTIASLRLPDGTLDMARYRQLAASQGFTPEGFEARVRQDLSVRQVEAGITTTGFSAAAVADVSLNAFFEKREIQVARFMTADFATQVKPTESELKAFYMANQALFQSPEQVDIEYIVLDMDAVKKNIVISEVDIKSYYEQNALRLSGNEERRASHILINAAKDAPEAERLKAKMHAEKLLQDLRQSPGSFAEIAKNNSQDIGSAANGGDLDFFTRGAMVKPFEDAVFALKKGEVSDVIESDFGYHIIKLTDVKIPLQRSFESLRESLLADLKAQQAQTKFAEIAESFTNGVYEQSNSLKPVADRLNLEIKTATQVTRQPAPRTTGALSNTRFLTAIFGADAIEKKRNTEVVETAPNQLTAGRVVKYTEAKTLALADVADFVRDRVIAANAAELAKKEGLNKLATWLATPPALSEMPSVMVVGRDQTQNTSPQILNAALRAEAAALPTFVGVDLGSQGFSVVRVLKLVPRQPPAPDVTKQDRLQHAQWWTAAENQAYYGFLKDQFKVKMMIMPPRPVSTDLQTLASR